MTSGCVGKRLGDLFVFKNGRSFKKEEWKTAGLPIIRIQNLNNRDAGFNYFDGEFSPGILVKNGDLLFSWSGTVGTSFGPHLWDREDGLLNQHIFKIGFKDQSIERSYAFYALWFITKEIEQSVNGAVGLAHVTKEKLNEFTIPVPSLTEQQRIVAILDEAFASIATARAAAEQNRQNARALFQSGYIEFFQQVVANGYRPTTVAEVAHPSKGSMRTGPFGSQLLHSEFVDEGVAVLGIDNAVSNEFRWDKRRYITQEKYSELSRYRVKPGDVIITIMGTCGRCAIVPDDIPLAINTKHLCCITLDPNKCIPEFLHGYFLYHPAAQKFLTAQAKGSIMAGLNMGIISALPILLPSLAQQQEIADKAGVLQEETQRLEPLYQRKLEALDELKQSLLHQAFSGNL
jgi:restriction endonuclease S subunit